MWLGGAQQLGVGAHLLPVGDPKLASSCLDKCKADTDKLNSTPAQVDMHELILAVCMLAGSVDGLALYGAPRVARRRRTRPRFTAARP